MERPAEFVRALEAFVASVPAASSGAGTERAS
jgi:hypothetical protein